MTTHICKDVWRSAKLLHKSSIWLQRERYDTLKGFIKSPDVRKVVSCRRYCQAVGDSRNIDPSASKCTNVLYLDTLKMSKRLASYGFSTEQAEAITKALSEVTSSSIEHQSKVMVTKPQQEVMVQQLMAQIASVKKDMVILEKSEFTMIRNDTEKQGIQVKQLHDKLNDDIKKHAGQIKLDINLERSRAIEAHALNEKNLQSLVNKMEVEHANNEKNLKMLDNKIDVELSNLRLQNEKKRNDLQKFILGLLASAAALSLGYLRLVK